MEKPEKPAQSRYCIRAEEHGSQVASPIAMSLALA